MKRIVALLTLLMLSGSGFAQFAEDGHLATRYGTFTLGKHQMLLYKGHPLQPPVQGNNSLDLGASFQIGDRDVILATILGGTACPYLYQFITVTGHGAKATPTFGTCNEVTNVRHNGDSILLDMHGYRGPFEPDVERRKAERELHHFVFRDGAVRKDGKPAK